MSAPHGGRHAESSPFGKLSDRIELMVSEPTKNGLCALSAALGLSLSEFVRNLLDREVHGRLRLLREACGRNDTLTIRGSYEERRDEP